MKDSLRRSDPFLGRCLSWRRSRFVIVSWLLILSIWLLLVTALFHRKYYEDLQQWSPYSAGTNQNNAKSDAVIVQRDMREQLLLPGQKTFTQECQSHYLYNATWGKQRAPWADKFLVKRLLKDLQIADLRIPRTLTHFNKTELDNMSVEGLQERLDNLPRMSYIIKPTHTSGAVARVVNGSIYSCFKKCRHPANNVRLRSKGYNQMLKNMRYSIEHKHYDTEYEKLIEGRQMQYVFIPKRILVETHLKMEGLYEWHWWVVNGHPVFVCVRCGDQGSYFSTRYHPLNVSQGLLPCEQPPPQPHTWAKMLRIVTELGKHVSGVIRIDLYADDKAVYFSEFTFTSTGCSVEMEPLVAEALLYAVLYNNITSEQATPELVERVLNDRPCVQVETNVSQWSNDKSSAKHHASPSDLCRTLEGSTSSLGVTSPCIEKTKLAVSFPLQCVAVDKTQKRVVQTVGQFKETSWSYVIVRVDWIWACGVALVLVLLKLFRVGDKEQRQYRNVALYLTLVCLCKWQSSINDGLFSPESIWSTITQSYHVFAVVHPMGSQLMVFTHIATYWFEIAAWRARTLQGMLGWYLMYELVAAFVNEYSHHQEMDDRVRCMRVLFVSTMKQYAVNDIVRAYLCAPILVYGYLLPKMIIEHALASTIGLVSCACVVLFKSKSKSAT